MPERDVTWDLNARDKTGGPAKSAADNFDKLGRKADEAKRKIDDLGDETGHLARKMAEARLAAASLAREFDKTGDSKLLKDFGKANAEAARLGRVMKTLKFDAPEVKDSKGFLGKFVKFGKEAGLIAGDAAVDEFGEAFEALPGPLKTGIIVALGGAAAAAAPIVAGALEGAVLAGIASGGIATGLILGARNPAVVQAYGQLGTRINQRLTDDVMPFSVSMIGIAGKLSDAFDQEEPRFKRIMAALSTTVGPLVDDALEAAHRLGPAFERASYAGMQILKSIGSQLPALADDVGNLIDAFTAGGPGAAAAIGLIIYQLRGLISLLAFGAQQSAPFLNLFGKIVEMSGFAPKAGGQISVLTDITAKAGTGAALTAEQYAMLGNTMGNMVARVDALNASFNRLFNEQMSVDQANLAVNMGLQTLKETIKDNKKTLDEHTESGAQNVQVILSQIQALDAKRQADINAGNGTVAATQQANAAYVAQLESLRKLLYSLGLNKAEVDKLIDSYERLAQPQTKIFTTVYRTQGTPPGYSDQLTGHSRTGSGDYSGLSGWAPAQFAGGRTAALAGSAGGGSAGTYRQPPTQVHSELALTVELDGSPFQTMVRRTTRAAERRQAWRARVGKR